MNEWYSLESDDPYQTNTNGEAECGNVEENIERNKDKKRLEYVCMYKIAHAHENSNIRLYVFSFSAGKGNGKSIEKFG